MKKFAIVLAMLAAATLPASVNAAANQCRDAKGHFVKCPTAPASPAAHATPAPHPSASPHTATPQKGTTQRCRNAKGQYAKCGTPGAKPA
jgi:hypothetical protein